jgi:(5-formylfuran-3-yl)methyl phosphate synthase
LISRPRILISVMNVDEAQIALNMGVDFIDLKNPDQGALGALPHETIQAIVNHVGGRTPLSATIGDLPMIPERIIKAVQALSGSGVDIVKIGFFGQKGHLEVVNAFKHGSMDGVRRYAVFFAEYFPSMSLISEIKKAGFEGVMLDTAVKNGRRLTQICTLDQLKMFMDVAQVNGLTAGLAGAINLSDIETLFQARPDFLGFRSAVSHEAHRSAPLDSQKIEQLLAHIAHHQSLVEQDA